MSISIGRIDTALQTSSCQHARALQLTLALVILALAIIASLSHEALDRAVAKAFDWSAVEHWRESPDTLPTHEKTPKSRFRKFGVLSSRLMSSTER